MNKICTYTLTCTHTQTHIHTHPRTHTHAHTNTRSRTHTRNHIHTIFTHIQLLNGIDTHPEQAALHTHTVNQQQPVGINTQIKRIHTLTHTNIRAHARTHKCSHTHKINTYTNRAARWNRCTDQAASYTHTHIYTCTRTHTHTFPHPLPQHIHIHSSQME